MNELSFFSAVRNESPQTLRTLQQSKIPQARRTTGAEPKEGHLPETMESGTGRIRLLIADDHGVLRAGLAMLLEAQPDMEVAGEATTGTEAVKAVDKLQPDIVLMDLSMPDMDGFEATRLIRARHPSVAVLALTMYDGEEHFLKALQAGAVGFVPKRAIATELIAAIRSIHKGDVFLYPSMAKALLTNYLSRTPTSPQQVSHDGLTARELEVLQLLADGLMNRDIADKLGVTESTVERHRANIMEKLNLHSRTELIKYAVRKGIAQIGRHSGRAKGSNETSQTRRVYTE